MHIASWSDDQFRSFMTALRDSGFPSLEVGVDVRDGFLAEARTRLVPQVQRRILAEVGVTTAAAGVALVAFEILERETWGKRHTWLLASSDPWGVLTELTAREVRAAYRTIVEPAADRKKLKRIAAASSQPEIEPGSTSGDGADALDGAEGQADAGGPYEPEEG